MFYQSQESSLLPARSAYIYTLMKSIRATRGTLNEFDSGQPWGTCTPFAIDMTSWTTRLNFYSEIKIDHVGESWLKARHPLNR